jgi:hypothetical protein
MVYGSKPYNTFESALLKLFPTAIKTTMTKLGMLYFQNIIH